MVTSFVLIQIFPLVVIGPNLLSFPAAAGLAASTPMVWLDLIPTLMS